MSLSSTMKVKPVPPVSPSVMLPRVPEVLIVGSLSSTLLIITTAVIVSDINSPSLAVMPTVTELSVS